jgi:hypothetical protein
MTWQRTTSESTAIVVNSDQKDRSVGYVESIVDRDERSFALCPNVRHLVANAMCSLQPSMIVCSAKLRSVLASLDLSHKFSVRPFVETQAEGLQRVGLHWFKSWRI